MVVTRLALEAGGETSRGVGRTLQVDALYAAPAAARWLVAWLPAFRLERCGHRADDLVAGTAVQQNATRVIALTPPAREAGLREGMTVAEARVRCPEIGFEPIDVEEEAADHRALVDAMRAVCDRVIALDRHALAFEIGHLGGVHHGAADGGPPIAGGDPARPGERDVLAAVRARLADLGHRARLVVADHPEAARALARGLAVDAVVPVGKGAEALAGVPLTRFPCSEAFADALQALGLTTAGELARLDPAAVAGRFGEEGVRLHQVVRGVARPTWVERPVEAPPAPVVRTVDDEVVSHDGLVALVREALGALHTALSARELAVARLELRLTLAWGADERLRLRLARPTAQPDRLLALLADRLARTTLEAPVTGFVLRADEVASAQAEQVHLLQRRAAREPLGALVSRLVDVLGAEAVVRIQPAEAWRPEDAWAAVPLVGEGAGEGPGAGDDGIDDADDPVALQEATAWRAPRPRPVWLRPLPRPLAVRAHPDGRPEAVRGSRGWCPVRAPEGPERLEGAWWEDDGGFARDYWVVGLPTGRAWIFHERDQWFLHGWFD